MRGIVSWLKLLKYAFTLVVFPSVFHLGRPRLSGQTIWLYRHENTRDRIHNLKRIHLAVSSSCISELVFFRSLVWFWWTGVGRIAAVQLVVNARANFAIFACNPWYGLPVLWGSDSILRSPYLRAQGAHRLRHHKLQLLRNMILQLPPLTSKHCSYCSGYKQARLVQLPRCLRSLPSNERFPPHDRKNVWNPSDPAATSLPIESSYHRASPRCSRSLTE